MKNRDSEPSDSFKNDRERNDALNKSEKDREDKLPGDYPANEDIMNRQNMQRVGLNVENFARGIGIENFNKVNEPVITDGNAILDDPDLTPIDELEQPSANQMERPIPKDFNRSSDNIEFEEGNESDVTDEDLQALGPKDLSMDMGDDEMLKNRVWPVDMAGGDLDIPGSELDDDNEAVGSEDEENNSYSIGGDGHEDNLEGK